MSKQKITSFFKPVSTKRVSSEQLEPELDVKVKKPKLEACEEKNVAKDGHNALSKHSGASESPVGKGVKEHSEAESKLNNSQVQSEEKPEDTLRKPDDTTSKDKTTESNPCSEEVKNGLCKDSRASESPVLSEEIKPSPQVPDGKVVKEHSESELNSQVESEEKPENTLKNPDDTTSKDKTTESNQCSEEFKNEDSEKKTDVNSPAVLKDVTGETENKSDFTTPVKPENKSKFVSTPLGMLSPLQCLAKIKSQCCKTPVLHQSIGPTWFFALQSEYNKPYFTKLSQYIVEERKRFTIYPPEHQVWTWTTLCPIKDIKVVILGQDPYHNPRQAHGLCFSVQSGVPPPPSLVNMYKELKSDIPGFKAPSHGNLTGWAQQGVLLLNACLTVRANSPNSHKDKGWEQLTDAVIKRLSDTGNGIVFLLWGSYALKKGAVVNKKKHHILQTVHPSPLSAQRGFVGCKHFSKCNALLEKSGKKPIDWARLPLV